MPDIWEEHRLSCIAALREIADKLEKGDVQECFVVALRHQDDQVHTNTHTLGTNFSASVAIAAIATAMDTDDGGQDCVSVRMREAVLAVMQAAELEAIKPN